MSKGFEDMSLEEQVAAIHEGYALKEFDNMALKGNLDRQAYNATRLLARVTLLMMENVIWNDINGVNPHAEGIQKAYNELGLIYLPEVPVVSKVSDESN